MAKGEKVQDFKKGALLDAAKAEAFTGRLFDKDVLGKNMVMIGATQGPDTEYKGETQSNFIITAVLDGTDKAVEVHTRHGWGKLALEKLNAPGAKAIRCMLIYRRGATRKDGRYYLSAPDSKTDALPAPDEK